MNSKIPDVFLDTSRLWKPAHKILDFCKASSGNSEPKKQLSENINNRMYRFIYGQPFMSHSREANKTLIEFTRRATLLLSINT